MNTVLNHLLRLICKSSFSNGSIIWRTWPHLWISAKPNLNTSCFQTAIVGTTFDTALIQRHAGNGSARCPWELAGPDVIAKKHHHENMETQRVSVKQPVLSASSSTISTIFPCRLAMVFCLCSCNISPVDFSCHIICVSRCFHVAKMHKPSRLLQLQLAHLLPPVPDTQIQTLMLTCMEKQMVTRLTKVPCFCHIKGVFVHERFHCVEQILNSWLQRHPHWPPFWSFRRTGFPPNLSAKPGGHEGFFKINFFGRLGSRAAGGSKIDTPRRANPTKKKV